MAADNYKRIELYELIHGLQSHEKACYKKMAKRHANDNRALHILLFELMEQHPVRDEKLFAAKLDLQSQAHYSGLKTYLWNDILSTIVYLKRNEPIAQLQFIDLQFETLLEKNLIISAGKLLEKAWKTAVKYELYTVQLKLVHQQYKILSYSDYKSFKAESEKLLQYQATTASRLQCEQQLQMIIRELIGCKQFNYLRLSEVQLARIAEMREELSQITTEAECALLFILHQFACGLTEHLAYHFETCVRYTTAVLEGWTRYPHLIAANPSLFLSCADYTFYNAFALKQTNRAVAVLQQYSTLSAHLEGKNKVRWELIAFNTQLKICHKHAAYDEVGKLIAEKAGSILNKVKEVLPPVTALSLMCSICISYFVLDNFELAEDLLLDVMNINHEVQREDILYFSAIFYLVILYEKKDYLQLSNAISATYYRLYNKKKLGPFEKDLMLFLRHLSNKQNNEGRRIAISDFLSRLDVYKNDPVRELYFLYFNYYDWLQSKVRRVKYTQYRKMQLENQA